LDNHGRCCTPLKGWSSITVEDEQWLTSGVPEWAIAPGLCCHFDGEKSPNVRAGRTTFPYIYTYENHLADQRFGRDSSMYWSQTRGFWPPDGLSMTVFSETMIDRFDGRGTFTFVSRRIPCAFLDTAFGGDLCVLQFGSMGDLHDGRMALQLEEKLIIQISVLEKHEVDYQVARTFIAECRKRGLKPEHCGLDATGIGRGVAAIVMQEWSDRIQYIEWGGKASDKPASDEDPRPGTEVYFNRVAELWFSCRELLRSGLLKGLYQEAIIEFTIREFRYKSRKIELETKEELRERLHRSPDHADAIAGLVEIARIHGVAPGGMPRSPLWERDEPEPAVPDEHAYAVLDEDVPGLATMDWP
jgi:hypothetical protein